MSRRESELLDEQSQPLTRGSEPVSPQDGYEEGRPSGSSLSTTSLMLEHVGMKSEKDAREALYAQDPYAYSDHDGRRGAPEEELDMEDAVAWKRSVKPADRKARRVFMIVVAIGLVGWVAAFFLFLSEGRHKSVYRPHDPHATQTVGHGKKVTLEQVLTGQWYARSHSIRWIPGPDGEDGLLLERGGNGGKDYLVVEDVMWQGAEPEEQKEHSVTLMKHGEFDVDGYRVRTSEAWPNADHTKVLVRSDFQSTFRHSGIGLYWIFDVQSQIGQPLDPEFPQGMVQHASWSPTGDAVVFTRDNNMHIRQLGSDNVEPITTDGSPDLFYGIPDWVYEEEVFASDSATWWSGDGRYVAFLRTNESNVPEFPVQYFFSRPSGLQPKKGEENYPDVRRIKYPKAGAPMSVVSLGIYDVEKGGVFEVPIEDDFENWNRLITEVLWASDTGKLLVRSTNRESDILKMILIDAEQRTGKTVRERDVLKLDGGWFEVTHTTTFVPASPSKKRPHDGYIDTVIYNGYDHLAYFSPMDNPEPKMLTEGKWEVVHSPHVVDLQSNIVYFTGTKHGSTQRHIYTMILDEGPESVKAVTDTSDVGYFDASFSTTGGYMLLSYQGPGIPWQRIKATPSNKHVPMDYMLEENKALANLAEKTELPIEIYQTIEVDGFELNVVERRPPHFDDTGETKYPVLFYLYNGPGFQQVDRKFTVDFQSYVASSLGYIVVTVDGRGTGYMGRAHRTIVRGNIGYWEAHDQIAAAKMWAAKKYVDADRLAIWGWSYGGFMTLKTLELDAGKTFRYGMAVAPVTDWRFYDSIYTERYMHTPQHNPSGYDNATISDVVSLSKNVKFLVMHGASDDNVHFQNTLALLDKLDLAGVRNYDVHIFPDSDHSIYFHNANAMVYKKLSDWLVNAFNGEWLRTENPVPSRVVDVVR